MRRRAWFLTGILACGTLFGLRTDHPAASQSSFPAGPTMIVGTATYSSGLIAVPIFTAGDVPDSYVEFQVHLRWDATEFSFASANGTRNILDEGGAGFGCWPPSRDGDGAGVTWGCMSAENGTSVTGLLGVITLVPLGSGCSALHLMATDSLDPDNSIGGELHRGRRHTHAPVQHLR